jgi:hypothetical protein
MEVIATQKHLPTTKRSATLDEACGSIKLFRLRVMNELEAVFLMVICHATILLRTV